METPLIPVLETEHLILRELRIDDVADTFEYAQDPEIARLGLWEPARTIQDSIDDITGARERYLKGNHYWWAVEHRQHRKLIGRIGLDGFNPEKQRAETGYAFNRRFWGQGFATESLRAVLRFGFEQLNLDWIGAICLPDNPASIRVLEKVGMRYERSDTENMNGVETLLSYYGIARQHWLDRQEES